MPLRSLRALLSLLSRPWRPSRLSRLARRFPSLSFLASVRLPPPITDAVGGATCVLGGVGASASMVADAGESGVDSGFDSGFDNGFDNGFDSGGGAFDSGEGRGGARGTPGVSRVPPLVSPPRGSASVSGIDEAWPIL